MDMYHTYDVVIRKVDRDKADEILWNHYHRGDLDDLSVDSVVKKDRDGNDVVVFRIKPCVYEDLETIKNEFRQAGIQIL